MQGSVKEGGNRGEGGGDSVHATMTVQARGRRGNMQKQGWLTVV